jgi:hypothetical protein
VLNRNENDKILEKVDEHRRGFLKRVLGASFAAPLIASFSVETLLTSSANANLLPNTAPNQNDPLLFELWWAADGR